MKNMDLTIADSENMLNVRVAGIIIKDGKTTPKVAANEPNAPAVL